MATANTVAAAYPSEEEFTRIEEEELQGEDQRQLTYCYEEIKNLLWIENHPVHKRALEEWERKTKLFTARVERKKKQSGDLRNEIYNLVGFFSVFQGVLLTAVSQSNLLHCNNSWSPLSLSTLASVVAIAGVWQKFRVIEDLEKTIHKEDRALKVTVNRSSQLRLRAADFRFYKVDELPHKEPQKSLLKYKVVVLLSLLAFSGLFLASHELILCDSDT